MDGCCPCGALLALTWRPSPGWFEVTTPHENGCPAEYVAQDNRDKLTEITQTFGPDVVVIIDTDD